MNLKKLFLPIAVIALALGLAACGNDDKEEKEQEDAGEEQEVDQEAIDEMNAKLAEQEIDEEKVVAVVNEEELDGKQFNTVLRNIQIQYQQMGQDPTTDELKDLIQEHTLNNLVSETLFLQDAKAQDTEVLPEEIDNEYGMFVEQFGGEEALAEALESEGMEIESFKKEQIPNSLLYSKHLEKVAPAEEVSDEEIKTYYDQFADQSEGEGEVPPLEDLSDEIEKMIAEEQQQEKLQAYLEKLKEDADIELKI